MKLLLLNKLAFMATPLALRSIIFRRASFAFSSAAAIWDGGVSMVQGASRGIGLEFVSFYFLFALSMVFMQSSCI